ncbi:MAG: peptidase S1 [Chloroflexi bacterium]|nr:MAG: peptidase S1 [Chloroflexota bacterium]
MGVLATFAALLIYRAIFPPPSPLTANQVGSIAANVMASATPPPAFSARVYQVIQPSLVLIESHSPETDDHKEGDSLGSGVVITDQGDILTSLHVVADSDAINVIFADGTSSPARIETEQPEMDIAVLRPEKLPRQVIPAILGDPNSMRIGDEAYAVGNPFGLYGTMSAGVISGFDRSFQSPTTGTRLKGLIQVDAAVNPGNSGGPLVNRDGHVVGIVVGILNPTDQDVFIGIGFAVPITVAGGAMGSPPD